MRLSTKEVTSITAAFKICLGNMDYQLYLFGSRTDDSKKGGDIDLLVVVPLSEKQNVVNMKSKIRNEIFKNIPEQKIDITAATAAELKTDEFLESVFEHAILVCALKHSQSHDSD
jgi:predicted nucleotidyltransferase